MANRANWNFLMEKGLINIMKDHISIPMYRGQNGWTAEGWRSMKQKFDEMFPLAGYSKQQLQEKEKELKGNYKIIRDAKKESGAGWNDAFGMIIAEPKIWEKMIEKDSRVSKFQKKPFPLFSCLESLYAGSIATGDLNFTSTQAPPPPPPPPPPPVPVSVPATPSRSISEQSLILTSEPSNAGNNPFGLSLEESTEAQSAPPTQREIESSHGKKRKTNQVAAVLEDYVEFKKNQTSRTLEDVKKHEEQYSIKKCIGEMDMLDGLNDDEKALAVDLFESEMNRELFVNIGSQSVKLLWIKRKIRALAGNDAI